MRWRVLLVLSLMANLGLVLAWVVANRRAAPTTSGMFREAPPDQPAEVRTNVVFRRQFFLWRELESPDYATYIANLRSIACPEQTIRDIIIADVNALYARRRATEVLTAEQQWWRPSPDPEVHAAAVERLRLLDVERQTLLANLLGPRWETGDQVSLPRPTRPGVNLDGPVLGALPSEVKQTLQEISSYSQDRLQAYLEACGKEGRTPDPAELAKLRQQTRTELSRVLTPQQLEEFLLRFSQSAITLRTELGQLQYFNATPAEFRALFRIRDQFDQQLALLGDPTDPATALQREALGQRLEAATRVALGDSRFAEYTRLQDAAFRASYGQADQAGVPEAAGALYEIRQVVNEEAQRIQNDLALTDEQKTIELARIELERLKANALALGQELPPEPPEPPSPMQTHAFRERDSLIGLALQYNVSVSSIIAANPNLDFHRLRLGDTIQIPQPQKPKP